MRLIMVQLERAFVYRLIPLGHFPHQPLQVFVERFHVRRRQLDGLYHGPVIPGFVVRGRWAIAAARDTWDDRRSSAAPRP